MALRKTGEFERIDRIFAPLAQGLPGALDLLDDAAILSVGDGCELVVTTDTIVAGVHYVGDEPAELIAQKLLRVNLSDLASMGARPIAYTLNIALPPDVGDEWLEAFARGLAADQQGFGLWLAGGDSVSTPGPVTLTITAMGEAPLKGALRRSGAGDRDVVYVTGTIGDGALGLKAQRGEIEGLDANHRDALIARYRRPEPRIECGLRLRGVATAAIDVSDGLVADLVHIAATSGVAAVVQAAAVPISDGASAALQRDPSLWKSILGGGDDYELLFAAPEEASDEIAAIAADLGLPIKAIGRIETGRGVRVLDAEGAAMEITRGGYTHR
ncbi:MAG: thiamine-phosphate kinase [Pseudomonadota bacterium]